MTAYEICTEQLRGHRARWLVTGAAGFIGSHLVEALLKLGQQVVGLDNFSTGSARNLAEIRQLVPPGDWNRFSMIEGDVRDLETCEKAVAGVDYILHQAAMASVPKSLEEPLACHATNVTGFANLLVAATQAGIRRVVYASSCAVYGNDPALPKTERSPIDCLSPYALTKLVNELYAELWARCYDCETIGLRYFNVFGPRQDPDGPYAAVIAKWISALAEGQEVVIFGDGESTRAFCYVANVVQANILAATTTNPAAINQVYNIGVDSRTNLNTLYTALQTRVAAGYPRILSGRAPVYQDFRPGEVRHSGADIAKAKALLGYAPTHQLDDGLDEAIGWYLMQALSTDPSTYDARGVLS
jgi:UDP-N-acetylglucosamine/UDP-N-acetyl-alpha-D-glucosaminouronate 4-epimerase